MKLNVGSLQRSTKQATLRPIKKKLEWAQITKIGNETLYNINNFTKIKGLLQNTMNEYTSKKLANLDEMGRFIKGQKLLKLRKKQKI